MRTRFVPPVRGGLTVTQQYRGNTESNTNKYGPENLNKYGPGNLDTNVLVSLFIMSSEKGCTNPRKGIYKIRPLVFPNFSRNEGDSKSNEL